MPTIESMRRPGAVRSETIVSTAEKGWQQRTVRLMRQRRRFVLETPSDSFDPTGYSATALLNWVRGRGPAINGCGFPAVIGMIVIGLSLLAPEPISRSMLVSTGIVGLAMVARVLWTVHSARYYYYWRVSFNPERRTYWWIADPSD